MKRPGFLRLPLTVVLGLFVVGLPVAGFFAGAQ